MRILVSGSNGFIGSALIDYLSASDAIITRLVRAPGWVQAIHWDPMSDTIEPELLENLSAVIHLAGESVTRGRWTRRKRARIRESRVRGTRLLAESLARTAARPEVLLSGSAIGYYGDRGEELLREDSSPGTGFLSDVCRDWEEATRPAEEAGIRVVHLRTGIVLGRGGGILPRLIRPFRLGLGGPIGGGNQIMSWITIYDLIGAILHAMFTDRLHGPINCVAPDAVSNYEFVRQLGKVLRRPAFFPLPGPLLRLALGRKANELLLASARVEPRQLQATGFRFRFPDLALALEHLLQQGDRGSRPGLPEQLPTPGSTRRAAPPGPTKRSG